MPTWIAMKDALQYVVDARGIDSKRAPVFLHAAAAQSGVRTRATSKGGVALAVPKLLPATLWSGQTENPIRWEIQVLPPDTGVIGTYDELRAELGDWSGIEVCVEDLRKCYPPSGAASPADPDPVPAKRRGGGRTEDYDWDYITAELIALIIDLVKSGQRIPSSDKKLTERLLERLPENESPDPEYLASRIRPLMQVYRARRR